MEMTVNNQRIWGWKVAAYLFLAGTGAGAYLAAFVISLFYHEMPEILRTGVLLGPPLVIVGIIFLFLDLGKKAPVLRAFSRPGSSWIARGIIIITAFVVLGLVNIGTGVWPGTWLEGETVPRLILGSFTALFAFLTLVYTGMLLGAARPVVLWDSNILPGLFLVSGISTGIMAIALYISVSGAVSGQSLLLLARLDSIMIIVEVVALAYYLLRVSRQAGGKNPVKRLLRGDLAAPFWGGVVAAGLAIPLAFNLFETGGSVPAFTAVPAIIGLFGGFMLRYVVVAGGENAPLNINGLLVPVPVVSRVRFYK